MKEYSLTEQFALVALDGMDSQHNTQAKKAVVCGIAAAKILEELLAEGTEENVSLFEERLSRELLQIKKLSSKKRKQLKTETAAALMEEGALSEVPDLLGCDINYYTANITMRQYKAEEMLYSSITEGVKAVILEPGEIPVDTVGLLWLFRESGCLHDIFSVEEQKRIESRMMKLQTAFPLYQVIWSQEFYSSVINGYKKILYNKNNLFKNPYLEGINLLFPFLDRRQAVFIDTIIFNTTVAERRGAVINFLREHGHSCEEIRVGDETLVKIDNGYYRIWPATKYYKLPVQGVELLPVYKL